MEASTVYYTDFRCPVGTSLTDKLRRLCIAAGIKNIDMEGKFVAIKMHFGELGNLAYLRPNYAKVVADLCKEQGGMPFLTDCNTLYPGSRKNALEHLTCAQLNGFWPMTTGCQVIIADGLRGTDEVEVPVPNGEYCKTAKIGRAIMDADIFISLSHFKGHESTGFGGAIKNIGMGCGSRAGKMEQHASGHPAVQEDLCRGCHRCAKECGSDAISYNEKNKAVIDQDKCKPRRERRAHPAGHRHVRLLRPGGPRPGLCRRLPERRSAAQQPAGPEPRHPGLELPPRQLQGL